MKFTEHPEPANVKNFRGRDLSGPIDSGFDGNQGYEPVFETGGRMKGETDQEYANRVFGDIESRPPTKPVGPLAPRPEWAEPRPSERQ
jgi:hypothetical protein